MSEDCPIYRPTYLAVVHPSTYCLVLLLLFFPPVALAAHFVHPTTGYALDYPDSWHVDQAMLDVNGPLFLSSFPAGAYRRSGLLPSAGIEIEVNEFPGTTDEDVALIPALDPVTNLTRGVQGIAPLGGLRADYDFAFTDRTTYRTTSTCLRVRDKLFVIRLTYERLRPTPREIGVGEAVLSGILSSLSIPTQQ